MEKKIQNEDIYTDDFLSAVLEAAKPYQEEVDFKMKLAAKIIAAVRAKGWNNTAFAERMGINPNSLSIITKWFSGTHNFESTTLHKIENVLGISLIDVEMPVASSSTGVIALQGIVGAQKEVYGYEFDQPLVSYAPSNGYQIAIKKVRPTC